LRAVPSPARGVLFDLDGTLLDTESVTLKAGVAAFGDQGLDVGLDVLLQLVGIDKYAGANMLRTLVPQADIDALEIAWARRSRMLLVDGVALKPGVADVLDALDAAGLPWAIATSSGRIGATAKIAGSGLAGRVAHLITVDDVDAAKPAPEPYLRAAALLGVAASDCVAFEDSETGARSARDAGCFVVQVPDLVSSEGAFADVLADSLLEGAARAGLPLATLP